jgi:hypothetical protein
MSTPECLGRVLAVEGSEVCIGLASPLPTGPDRPTVGKFVAIAGHETTLVGMISDVSLRAEAIDGSRTVARVDLLGEIERTPAGGARFRRGVREYAAIGDPARMLGSAELNLIYASTSARAITIGHLSQAPRSPPTSTPTTCSPSISPSSAPPASASPAPSPPSSGK